MQESLMAVDRSFPGSRAAARRPRRLASRGTRHRSAHEEGQVVTGSRDHLAMNAGQQRLVSDTHRSSMSMTTSSVIWKSSMMVPPFRDVRPRPPTRQRLNDAGYTARIGPRGLPPSERR